MPKITNININLKESFYNQGTWEFETHINYDDHDPLVIILFYNPSTDTVTLLDIIKKIFQISDEEADNIEQLVLNEIHNRRLFGCLSNEKIGA